MASSAISAAAASNWSGSGPTSFCCQSSRRNRPGDQPAARRPAPRRSRRQAPRSVSDAVERACRARPRSGARRRARTLYLVGGAARAIARLHMEHTHYPLHIVHQYTIPRREAEAFFEIVGRQSRKSLERITTISRKRLEVVPIAALILRKLIAADTDRNAWFSRRSDCARAMLTGLSRRVASDARSADRRLCRRSPAATAALTSTATDCSNGRRHCSPTYPNKRGDFIGPLAGSVTSRGASIPTIAPSWPLPAA